MRIACCIVGTLFLLFAWWQRNDAIQYKTADWGVIGWIVLYLFTAGISFFSAWKRLPRAIYLILGTLILANGIYRFTAIQWGGKILYNEQNPAGNESGGLFICGIWLIFLGWKNVVVGPHKS